MKKKLLSMLLAAALFLALIPTAFAASDDAITAANALYQLGLFKGTGTNADGTPNFDLDRAPTRNEAVTMLVRLLGKENEAVNGVWNIPFTDVAAWAKPYVGYAYANGLTTGTSATTFGGDAVISASQYITFVLRALGYESGTDFQWDKSWELSDSIGVTNGTYNAGTSSFTRGDVASISYNSLSIAKKNSATTIADELGLVLEKGDVRDNYSDEEALPSTPTTIAEALSAPFDTIEEIRNIVGVYYAKDCYKGGNFRFIFNSVGGVILSWGAKNTSNKDIKYITFTMNYYNNVGDAARDKITGETTYTVRLTGPIKAGGSFYLRKLIGYGSDISYGVITEIEIEYMDGATISGNYGYTTWHNSHSSGSPTECFVIQ